MFKSKKIEELFEAKDNSPVYIIAEIGINHGGSLEVALELIAAAKQAGVDAVKFQKRNLEKIYTKKIINDPNSAEWNFDYLIPILKKCELSEADYLEIRKMCDTLELDLIITPFDEDSADFVANLGISAFKISSADMTNLNLIKKCASYGLPLIISTGMWNKNDIGQCVDFYKSNNIKFALLLANSSYPAPYDSTNLGFLENLKKMCPVVGYSGHERGIFIPIAAVALGGRIIEKHITFDKNAEGPDHKASLLPIEFANMVHDIRMLEQALKKNKEPNQAEKLNKEVFAKSAVADKFLKKGHLLRPNDISFKSPGKGIFQHQIEKYYGRLLAKDIAPEQYISDSDFDDEILIKDWKKFTFKKKWGIKCRFHDFNEYKVLDSPVIEFHCSENDLQVDFEGGSQVSELIIHAPEIVDNELVDICSDDEVRVCKSLEILQKTIDKTIKISKNWPLAKPKIVIHFGGMLLEKSDNKEVSERMLKNAIKNFGQLHYSPEEVEILPENLPPRPWYLGGEWFQYGFMLPEDLITFCNHYNLGMTLDICHAALYAHHSHGDLNDYIRKVSKLVRHIHISDAAGISGEGLQIGEGEINFLEIMEIIKNIEFSWVSEIWSGHLYNGAGVYKSLLLLEPYSGSL